MDQASLELRRHLDLLLGERRLAYQSGLARDREYMADLADELEDTRRSYVISAVAERALATGRAGRG